MDNLSVIDIRCQPVSSLLDSPDRSDCWSRGNPFCSCWWLWHQTHCKFTIFRWYSQIKCWWNCWMEGWNGRNDNFQE